MNDLLVIGTEPQCPRCRLLSAVLAEKCRAGQLDARVRHCSYENEEAAGIGRKLGLTVQTAKEVARRWGRPLDADALDRLCRPDRNERALSPWSECNDGSWCQALDDYLQPWQQEAEHQGVLMTPVLVCDGRVLWSGSVPDPATLARLLSECRGEVRHER